MANQIKITPDQMKSRAAEYRTEGQKVEEVNRKMESLLNALQEEWSGEASRAYRDKFTELKPGFEKARNLIEEIAKALESTARIVEETDSSIASQFRG